MRFLMVILILTASVPTYAETAMTYSLLPTVRLLDLDYHGNRGLVQQYDGRQYDGGEVDFQLNAVDKNGYLEAWVTGLNSGNEDGYLDINLGSWLAVKGKISILTHRQPYQEYGVIINDKYISETVYNVPYASSLTPVLIGPIPKGDYITNTGQGVLFNRVESEMRAVFACPDNLDRKISAGIWQENETGGTMAIYNKSGNRLDYADVDRQTTELNIGLSLPVPVDEGAVSADYSRRLFKDSADLVVVDPVTINATKPLGPKQKMDLYSVKFRGNLGSIPVTGALSARTRENEYNGWVGRAYTATLGGAYKLNNKTHLTAKVYGRTAVVDKDTAFRSDLTGKYSDRDKYKWGGTSGPGMPINHYNLLAKLSGRYNYSDKLSFNAGYTYKNNHRRHAETEYYSSTATYQDGTYADGTQSNAYAEQDTKHIANAGLDALLPFDAELQAGYTKMAASHAVLESLATDSDQVTASLLVPLPMKLTLMTSGEYLAERNRESNLTDSKMQQNSYQTSLDWAASAGVSTGVDYAYEKTSYRSEGWFGAKNNPTGTVQLINLLHAPGMLYRYENNIYGYNASVKLPRGFKLHGRGSYTVSRGDVPVQLTPFRDAKTAVVTNLAPTDIRIASGDVALKYMHGGSRDLSASLGYRRDQWMDKVVSANSGWANVINMSVSARF